MKKLVIGDWFTLPVEAGTQTFAILAKRGMGKTYTALVLVEEMVNAGIPVVVVDPIGVSWGLRSAANGKGPGLPVVILGGEHGDVPLDVGAGAAIAEFVVAERRPVVLDLSLFRKGEQTRFMTDFAEALYHRNREPLHLVLDEADAFAPQRPQKGEERLLGACEDLVRRGRARGIGVTLVTQRAAVLNKSVLTQAEVLVALRTIAPQDRDAIEAWVKVHGTPEQRDTMMASLPSLPIGTAWFWSPGWLDVFERVEIRKRITLDSSATPKIGTRRAAPRELASVDLESLRARLAGAIERAEQDDPKALRRRIAELEKQAAAVAPRRVPVEVPVLTEGDRVMLQNIRDMVESWSKHLGELLDRVLQQTGRRELEQRPTPKPPPPARRAVEDVRAERRHGRIAPSGAKLAGGERKILSALAQYDGGRTPTQVAILTGYASNGGGFRNYLSALRSRGFIKTDRLGRLATTPEGEAALGPFDPLPTGTALFHHWKARLGKAERLILEELVKNYPSTMDVEWLAKETGYAADGGGFRNALSKLRTLELISGRGELKAADEFSEGT